MIIKWISLPVIALLISACSSTPSVHYYILEQSAYSTTQVKSSSQLLVGIGPVTLPALLDRKKIVTRLNNNAVQIAEFHQWAAPLQDNVTDVLRRNLALLQPNHLFRAYPWSIHGTVNLQIIIDVLRFDATLGKTAYLEANWTIKEEESQKVLKIGRTDLSAPLPESSYSAAAHGLSGLLGQFSQELSSAIAGITRT